MKFIFLLQKNESDLVLHPEFILERDTINSLIGTGFVILVTLILLQYMLFKTQRLTVTLLLLGCVWMLDIFLKMALEFDNTTAFADLSFSAFVFHLGAIFSVLENLGTPTQIEADYIYIALITFILLFCWIANLDACKRINKYSSVEHRDIFMLILNRILSCLLALISVFFVLIGYN